MPTIDEYEPTNIALSRDALIQARREQRLAAMEQRKRIREMSIAYRRGELTQQLPPYTPPAPVTPEQPPQENIAIRALKGGLEMIGRPAEAVRGAIAAPQYGLDPLTGAVRGLLGQEYAPGQEQVPGMEDIFQRYGVGELGGVNIPTPFGEKRLTGRGALSFGAGVATDPLMYIPFGGIAKAARGIGATEKLLQQVGPDVASAVLKTPSVARELEKVMAPTVGKRAVEAIGQIPLVGRPAKSLVRLANPSAAPKNLQHAQYIALERVMEKDKILANVLRGNIGAEFPQGAEALLAMADDTGAITLEGWRGGINDFMQQFDKLDEIHHFSPDVKNLVNRLHKYKDDLRGMLDKAGVEIDEVPLKAGERWFPRHRIMEQTNEVPSFLKPRTRGKAGFQHERDFPLQITAIDKGIKYVEDPIQDLMLYTRDVHRVVAETEFRKMLVEGGLAKMVNEKALASGRQLVKEMDGRRKELEQLWMNLKLGRIPKGDVGVEIRAAIFRGDKAAIDKRMGQLLAEAESGLKNARQILKTEKSVTKGLKGIAFEGLFRDLRFTPDEVPKWEQIVSKTFAAKPARTAAEIAAMPRMFSTTFDFAYPMLQGLPLLASNPVAWGKMMYSTVKTVLQPQTFYQYVKKNTAFYRELAGAGTPLPIANPEFFEAMTGPLGRLFGWGAEVATKGGVKGVAGKGVSGLGKAFERFQLTFDVGGVIARTEMAKALYPAFKKAGKLEDMVDLISRGTGVMSTASLGVSGTQRAIESALLFAPQYTRASLAFVGYALSGGIKGAEARGLLSSMLLAGPAMYIHAAESLGQEPQLDPTKANFLSVKLGNDWVGVGSVWMSLMRLFARSIEEPDSLLDIDDPLQPNPLVKFWHSRSSPTLGAAIAVATGQDYIGNDIDAPIGWLEAGLERMTPMVVEQYLWQNPKADIRTILPSLLGARVFPQRYADRRDTLAHEMFQKSYDELGPVEQAQISEQMKTLGLPEPTGRWGEQQSMRDKTYTEYGEKIETYAKSLLKGGMTGRQFREAKMELDERRDAQMDLIDEQFKDITTPRELSSEETVRQEYLSLFVEDPETGEVDFDAAEAFLSEQSEPVRVYIEQKQLAGIERLGGEAAAVVKRLSQDRKQLKPYFEIWRQAMKKAGLYELIQRMNPAQLATFKQTPEYKRVESQIRKAKENWRRSNPQLDAKLVFWGYVSKPIQ